MLDQFDTLLLRENVKTSLTNKRTILDTCTFASMNCKKL